MSNWQQRVWDYSRTGTKPDDGYWMRLMACQWIGSLEVIAFPPTSACGSGQVTHVPEPRGSGASLRPMRVPAPSVPPPRYAPCAARGPPPPPPKPQPPTSEHHDRDQQGIRTEDPFSVWRDPDAVREPAGPLSSSTHVACAVPEPPPGLPAPATVGSFPLWQFERDARKGGWMPMSQALCRHLEESYQQGMGEATFCVAGVNYYFDLRAMYQENPNTGTERRIRRRVI